MQKHPLHFLGEETEAKDEVTHLRSHRLLEAEWGPQSRNSSLPHLIYRETFQ